MRTSPQEQWAPRGQAVDDIRTPSPAWPPKEFKDGCLACLFCGLVPLQGLWDCLAADGDLIIETFWVQVLISITLIFFTIGSKFGGLYFDRT